MWASDNLKVTHFRNGDAITQVTDSKEWIEKGNAHEPAWCYYNNDSTNDATYGKLYNWYAVNDPRGLAPVGWHIPSYEDWMLLIDSQGGEADAGMNLKSDKGWIGEGNGTNASGFAGMPGGKRGSF
ncbi:MAG: fibrobacter succinogenes major paralogous domain-containing protein, partial [Flavobacteriales bacterium]